MANSVFIIGNGFDISLGLKTRYRDYVESPYFNDHLGKGKILFEHLHVVNLESRWIDIELELAALSRNTNDPNFLEQYSELAFSLCSYIKSLNTELDANSRAYKFLRDNYTPDSKILNFNYSNTIEVALRQLGYPVNLDSIHYIHGNAESNNIIFGVDDAANINQNHAFLYKSTSNHFNGRHVDSILHSAPSIFFFGHSLGESDHMYFRNFFSSLWTQALNRNLHFYHYRDEGLYELHKQLHILTQHNVSRMKSLNEFKAIDTST
jgi:hypothetical protein